MRATQLPKLLLKALRTDANSIASTPLNFQKLTGQTAPFVKILSIDGLSSLYEIDKDGGQVMNSGASVLQMATVSISAANIIATTAGKFGHAAGVVLVADPGAGKVVELVSAVMSVTYGVAAYTAGGDITININGGAALTGVISAAASLGAGASNIAQFVPLAATGSALTVNKGINLVAASAFTNPGTAAGTVKVFVTYRVHTL